MLASAELPIWPVDKGARSGQYALVQQSDLNRENSMVLYLSQALLGAVFPNLVAASVEVRPSDVVAHFRVASPPDPADLEDLEDIEVDFNAFVGPTCVIGGPDETSTQVHIGPAVKSSPVLPGRMVFLRKP